jgi:solute carrier family 25, member 38
MHETSAHADLSWAAAHAGGLSRGLATVILSPISLIKTKMEATGAYILAPRNNIYTVARSITQQHGVRGLWRGVVPTILSNAPFSGIYYCVYNEIRKAASGSGNPQMAVNFGAGIFAAMAATLATQPTDVFRAWVQLGAARGASESAAALRKHGSRVLMSGAMPRFLKRSLQTALVWTMYEELLPMMTSFMTLPAPGRRKRADP